MPTFEDSACFGGDLCITVWFPTSVIDTLVLYRKPGTDIYEGYLENDVDVPVVLIDVPITRKRTVSKIIV